ncbi:hypothetical protein D3C71_2009130 [compost metagenome]
MKQKHRMRQANQPEPRLPPQESRHEGVACLFGGAHLQGEAVAEEKGKEQVELHFEEQCDSEVHRAV